MFDIYMRCTPRIPFPWIMSPNIYILIS